MANGKTDDERGLSVAPSVAQHLCTANDKHIPSLLTCTKAQTCYTCHRYREPKGSEDNAFL